MKTNSLRGALAATLVAALCASQAPALEIAEVRGDFYYDTAGQLVGHRDAQLPPGFERRSMSHREKFELMGLELPPLPAQLRPRFILDKPAVIEPTESLMLDKVIVKFADGMEVRLRGGSLRAGGISMPDVDAILAAYPDAVLQRLFRTEERILEENKETGERLTGQELADLNNFYLLQFDTPSSRGADLANELNGLPFVELAYLQAKGEPAACGDIFPTTPDWTANQNYLGPAPGGLDSEYAWAYHAGGDGYGPGYWIADLEWDWCLTHEDLDFGLSDVLNGHTSNTSDFMNHGTAVLGIIGGCSGSWGVTGMANDVTLKSCDFDSETSWAANISTADSHLLTGEIMLLEIHIVGPASGETCICNCSQFELVPVEWDLASFTAIQTATSNGVIVVEAAGNGSMDLDHSRYGGAFNRGIRDSGAILVGAGDNPSHVPECWTNYGSRVDVHGYGSDIYTTGYGDWWGQSGCSQDYTHTFGGTSGASPMVVSASASLQGISRLKYGVTLTPAQMRDAMTYGGTPQGAPTAKNIGPMPNLVNGINRIEPDMVADYVPAGWSYPAVPRSVNNSNVGFVPLQSGPLQGNLTNTYFNWNQRNASYSFSTTLNQPQGAAYLDDTLIGFLHSANYGPGAWGAALNIGPRFVKGGRHTLLARSDFTDLEDELAEWNNDWSSPYIWSPLALVQGVPVTRTHDPPRTSDGWGPYFNCEGFSGQTSFSPYWYAFACVPAVATSDFDIRLHTETPMNIPLQGFGASVATSAYVGSASDFVIVDLNTAGSGTYYAGCLNYGGTDDKVVEFDGDQGVLPNPGTTGPFALAAGEIVDLHEVWLTAGVPTRIEIEWISGDADYGMSVYQTGTGFAFKSGSIAGGYSDIYGPGGDEFVVVDGTGFHGVVVWKKDTAALSESVSYNVIVSPMINLTNTTPDGWYGPVVPRNTRDATGNWAPLPPFLDGNVPTTSYNFSTFNQGPGPPATSWQTHLFVDDFWAWIGNASATPQATHQLWLNTWWGGDPTYDLVRGGRHYIRLEADATDAVPEVPETDNTWVDWFVWTPLELTDQTPLVREAPPVRSPIGWGPYFALDGFRADDGVDTYWTAVGVMPFSAAADYDVTLHAPSAGSKDGFGTQLGYSGDSIDGRPDFCLVNYNLTGGPHDYGAVNWNGAGDEFWIQQANAPYMGAVPPGVTRYGPFVLDPEDVLDLYEFFIPPPLAGQPVHFSVNNLGGGTDLGLILYDGTVTFHDKFTGFAYADAAGPGLDEHLSPVSKPSGYYALAVHKHDWEDGPKAAEYEIVVSTVGSVVDAPELGGPVPTAFALSAPRPNPSGHTTVFELAVPEGEGTATVAVFDLQGRRIVTLAEAQGRAGRHQLRWDGRDSAGREVAAGVYFVRLQAAGTQETRKLTLLR